MTDDLFAADDNNTALSPEEQLDLIPSLSTRAELNEAERANIHAARVWAMRPRTLKRTDLLTDAFARELHKRMFNQTWRWAGRYRKTEKNLGWEVARITEGMWIPKPTKISTLTVQKPETQPTHAFQKMLDRIRSDTSLGTSELNGLLVNAARHRGCL